jgi:hypothetical protein
MLPVNLTTVLGDSVQSACPNTDPLPHWWP